MIVFNPTEIWTRKWRCLTK